MKRILISIFIIVASSLNVHAQGDPILWRQTKGPIGGNVTCVCVDSNNNLTVSTQVAGMYRSTNNGDTWTPLNKGLQRLQGKQIVSDGGEYVFAMTYYNEILRHRDLEKGWEQLNTTLDDSVSFTFTELAANKKGYIFVATGEKGIVRTTDHGLTWHQTGDSAFRTLTFLRVTVARNGDIYGIQFLNNSKFNYVYRSTDDGDSWQKLPKEIPTVEDPSTIVIAPDNSIILGTFWGYVFRSSDNGNSWVQVFKHPNDHNIEFLTRSDHSSNNALFMSTHSNLNALVQTRTGGFYRSTDNGASWVLRDGTQHGESKFAIAVNKDGDVFHSSVPLGIIKSTDQGSQWFDKNNGILAQFLDGGLVVSNKHQPGWVFACTQFEMNRSTDGGETWIQLPNITRESFRPPFMFITANYDIFQGTRYGLFRSQNDGNSWEQVIYEDTATGRNTIYDVDQASNGNIFATTENTGLMVSNNGGTTWEKVPNLHPDLRLTAIGCGKDNTVLCADESSFFWLSENGGINWENVSSDNNGCSQIDLHPDGYFTARYGYRVDITTDKGRTWRQIFPDSARSIERPEWTVYSSFIDRHGAVLVTTDSGIFRSKVYPFNEWEFVAKGITAPDYEITHFTNVMQLGQDTRSGIFYAATRGQSVYKSLADLGVASSANSNVHEAKQNYPNPFSSRTTIPFTVTEQGRVKITISNILGNFERVIVDDFFATGAREIIVDARELPTGTYLYQIEYPSGKRESNMMIISK